MNSSEHTLPAPAKINLHLHVTGIRDDGRHELDTSFAYVDVADQLTIRTHNSLHVTCSDTHLEGESNLVWRVLTAMREHYGVSEGMHVHVEKLLPEQAGLGGGSSDAATAIIAANHLWGLNLPPDELITFAAPFGADIPCFLFGSASLAAGIGEHLIELPTPLPQQHIVLAHPGTGLSTAEVFARFDAGAQLTRHGAKDTMPARSSGQATKQAQKQTFRLGANDLEAVACDLCPELESLLAALRGQTDKAWMSGSGSACVALVDDADTARQQAEELQHADLARWTHVGKLLAVHPLRKTAYWGVAKR